VVSKKKKTDVDKLEQIQKRATKFIPELSKLNVLNLPTLKYRRYRGDMTEVFNKNSSGDEIVNVNFYAARPESYQIH